MPGLLLALTAAWLAWRWRRPRRAPAPMRGSARYFAAWSVRLAQTYGLPAVVGLALLRPAGGTWPAPFLPLATWLGHDGRGFPVALLLGALAFGSAVAAAIAWWRGGGRRWFGPPLGEPRTATEHAAALLLAATAGVAEELFFRLYLPLLIALTVGSVATGFVAATLLFGALHRYQGWIGVVATTLAGGLFAWVYLASGSIALAMLTHALVDVNALIVRPFFARLGMDWRSMRAGGR